MPNKVVKIVAVILLLATLAITFFLFTNNTDDVELIRHQYRDITQDFDRTTVSSTIEEANNDRIVPGVNSTVGNGSGSMPGQQNLPVGGVGGSSTGSNAVTTVTNGGSGPVSGLDYQPITQVNGLYRQTQIKGELWWEQVISTQGGRSIRAEGCYLFACASAGYNKYGINPAPGSQLEDAYVEYMGGTVSLDSAGHLVGKANGIGFGSEFGEYVRKYFGVNYDVVWGEGNSRGEPCNKSQYPDYFDSNGTLLWPTIPGEYIVYYRYSGGPHFIYIEVDSSGDYIWANTYSQSASGDPHEVAQFVDRICILK